MILHWTILVYSIQFIFHSVSKYQRLCVCSEEKIYTQSKTPHTAWIKMPIDVGVLTQVFSFGILPKFYDFCGPDSFK